MKIELFHIPGCERCASVTPALRETAAAVGGIEWCEIDALDSLDRAVELGVLTLPAIAIDGELVFAALPTPAQLRQALLQRAGRE